MDEINLIGQEIQGYRIIQKLGSGGYGTVYLGEKEDLGKKYQTAIKHISIPDPEGYESVLRDYGYDKAATQVHFEKMVEGITTEITTLLALSKKDNRYIVAYYDHDIQKTIEPLRFEIFLRMEYLTPLNTHMRKKGVTLGEVMRLGLNMCDALSLCHNSGVMHRDIKEANIFVNETGNFKLGDFGVAKSAIETTQAGSIKGTASYMAPEIYLREPYDSSVDIYSLGIVLYKLLNNQRLPFMPDAPASFTVDDRNLAETRRLKGETPPLPANAKNRLGEIVVKACSAKQERYTKAEDLKADLQEFLRSMSTEEYEGVVIAPSLDADHEVYQQNSINSYTQTQGATMTMGVQNVNAAPAAAEQNPYAKKPKKKKWKIAIAGVIACSLIAAFIAGYLFISNKLDPLNQFQAAIEKNDYEAAAQLYQEELKSGDSGKLAQVGTVVINRAEDIKENYYQGEIEYEDALNQLQELGKFGSEGEKELQAVIEDINGLHISRAAYERAQESMKVGNYESAVMDLHKVIQKDPDYAEAQKMITEAIKGYKDGIFASLSEFEQNKQYDEAILLLEEGLQVVPNDADFLGKKGDYEKKIENNIQLEIDRIIREAKSAVSVSADYEGALTELRAAVKQYPNRDELKTAVSEIEDAYLEKVLAEAEAIAGEKGYVAAVAALNQALRILPNNASIKSAISAYEDKYPVLLQQMVYFTGETLGNEGQDMDNLQGTQNNVIDDWNGFDNTYKLEGRYVRITGVLYQPFEKRSDTRERTLKIFGDGRLLYSATMKGGIEPISFDVNISGVSDLEISVSSYAYARLANVELYQ